MRSISLVNGGEAIVDDEDFEVLSYFRWVLSKDGYAYCLRKSGGISMHRVILRAKKGEIVDHINNNPMDNRKVNLRFCTKQQNTMNRKKSHGTSKYKGVCWCKTYKKWEANIKRRVSIHV